MAEAGVIGTEPVVRVAAGAANRQRARAVLENLRERATDTTVVAVGSTGLHDLEPLVLATRDGRTAYYPDATVDQGTAVAAAIEDEFSATSGWPTEEHSPDNVVSDGPTAVVAHDPDVGTLPTPEDGPLGVGDRTVLGGCGWVVPTSVADDRAAIEGRALAEREAFEGTITRLRELGLLGRGRGDAAADEPIGDRWALVRETAGEPVVIVNANEADPRSNADRLLCESAPLGVLDGALAASRAIEATRIVIYLGEDDTLARDRLDNAVTVFTTEFDVETPISVLEGPDTFMAGEVTAAIEAIEGADRLEARLRPPHPSEHGLDGRPTLVHTPRTLVQVRAALGDDHDGAGRGVSDAGGASSDPGTRVFTVGGDVTTRTTVELSTDNDLAAIEDAVGIEDGPKAACVGGVFGGLTRSLDVPARANALTAAGLGTAGAIEVFGEERCMVALAGRRARFAEDENCGRCVPCREGTTQVTGLLRAVYDGSYEDDMLRELARVMGETSICSFGQSATRPVTTAMAAFETEFRAHAEGRCPSGACHRVGQE